MGNYGRARTAYALGEGLFNIGKTLTQQDLLKQEEARQAQERLDKRSEGTRKDLSALGIYLPGVQNENLQSTLNEPAAPTRVLGGESMPGLAMPEPSKLQAPSAVDESTPIQTRQLSPDVSVDLPAPAKLQGTPTLGVEAPPPQVAAPTATKMEGTPNLMQEVGAASKKQVLNPEEQGYGAPIPLQSGRGYYQPQASEQTNYARTIAAQRAATDRINRDKTLEAGKDRRSQATIDSRFELQKRNQEFVKNNPDYKEVHKYDPSTGLSTSWFENVKTGEHAPGMEMRTTEPTYAGLMKSQGAPAQMDKAQAASDMLLNMKVMKEVEDTDPNAPQLAANSINALAAMKETPMGLGSFIAVLARTNGLQYDDPLVQKYGTAMYNYLQPVIASVGGKAVTANEIAIAMQGIVPFRNEDPASQAVKYANRVNKLTTAIAMAGPAWNNGLGGASAQQISDYFGVPIASTVTKLPGVPSAHPAQAGGVGRNKRF